MNATSHIYTQEKLTNTQPYILTFEWDITSAKTISSFVPGIPVLTAFDALASQSVIDDFLGTTNEFLAAQFDATAMGTDAFGGIVALRGEAERIFSVRYIRAAGGVTATVATNLLINGATGLSSSTLENGAALGANGNLAFRFVDTGLDALTDGTIRIECGVLFK